MKESLSYWFGLPFRWLYQMAHNGHGILRVLDIVKFRPMKPGLIPLDHPWVTGINPATGRFIWPENVIFRTEPRPGLADDELVLEATGKFLAERVRQSAALPELPIGPKRRMPHGINYIHGVSHYSSGILIFNDLAECYRHITDSKFRKELARFVRVEKREVLFLMRERNYDPKEYAYFSCCMRTLFRWFCNPNGPRGKVLWGNSAPFPAANLITGWWMRDVYELKKLGGAERVIHPPIRVEKFFRNGPYDRGRDYPIAPEKLLAWATYWRVKARGQKAGMFFVDRRKNYADQIANREAMGLPDEPLARF